MIFQNVFLLVTLWTATSHRETICTAFIIDKRRVKTCHFGQKFSISRSRIKEWSKSKCLTSSKTFSAYGMIFKTDNPWAMALQRSFYGVVSHPQSFNEPTCLYG